MYVAKPTPALRDHYLSPQSHLDHRHTVTYPSWAGPSQVRIGMAQPFHFMGSVSGKTRLVSNFIKDVQK